MSVFLNTAPKWIAAKRCHDCKPIYWQYPRPCILKRLGEMCQRSSASINKYIRSRVEILQCLPRWKLSFYSPLNNKANFWVFSLHSLPRKRRLPFQLHQLFRLRQIHGDENFHSQSTFVMNRRCYGALQTHLYSLERSWTVPVELITRSWAAFKMREKDYSARGMPKLS